MSKKGLFIRESSGLIREMGAKHSFGKVLALIVPISAYYTLIYSPALPSANWNIGIVIAAILALPIFFTYLKLAEYIPRSSGEYVYISRILGPIPATVQGIANIFSTPLLAALLSQIEISAGLAPAIQLIGMVTHNYGLLNLGTQMLTNPTFFFMSTAIVLFLMWIVSILPPRHMANFMFVIASLQVIGGILIVGILSQGMKTFEYAFNSISKTSFQTLYSHGLSYYSPLANPLETLIWAILMMMWLFIWFFAPSYFAGEYKKASNSLKLGMVSGYAVAAIIIFGLVFTTEYSMGIPFFNYVSLNGWGSSIPLSASSGYIAWAGIIALSSPTLAIIMAILNLGLQFVAMPLSLAIPSRVMLAMSFDRILPEKLAYVSPRLHTPLLASSIVLAMSMFYEYATQFLGFEVSVIVLIGILFLYQFLLATISALVGGIRGITGVDLKKEERRKLIFYGGLGSAILIMATFFALWYATINSLYASMVIGIPMINYLVIGLIPVAGVITFLTSKFTRKREGIDLELLFKEIPPE
ncbi:hypothetical protein CM19_00025 [Candidatus Acidianus copahuensis]|uniref:Amino acid permease n=1 Tax=Candidatus Acidianus copahuensis TaxID=1160895 RepID=A0A031LWT2_9CREN|nr:APC family permease [Candidatus Acidianus copahuensis]EZQ12276.1 hypothetical protein CM19_00025 [Candidatus Acidianus copahuensis]